MIDHDSLDRWSRFLLQTRGPFSFRFILQPVMAMLIGIRGGIYDAHLGRRPFLARFVKHPEERMELVKSCWKHVARLFIFAVALDMLVQWLMFKRIYPGGAILVGFCLAVPTYLLVRGPTNRFIQMKNKKHPPAEKKRAA